MTGPCQLTLTMLPRPLKLVERDCAAGDAEEVAAHQVGQAHAQQVAGGGDTDAVLLAVGNDQSRLHVAKILPHLLGRLARVTQ